MLLDIFLLAHADSGHGDLDHDHDQESGDAIIEIVDPDTDEVYQFYLGDEFDYEGQFYYVLVTIEDDPVYVIARVIEQDGESYIETLTDEENDELYDVYDKILEEAFEDEE
ncbi:MAG: DUF1292 domain-containing protein [Clostridiaceae bacterium]|jgi:uncharacterized protein YrzB (UPF0473 family)|nr:hypothetical protein [Bacillota bacterium]NLN51813.1 DUF1292 domain-containing protein [Clostridiaceae bacterium]